MRKPCLRVFSMAFVFVITAAALAEQPAWVSRGPDDVGVVLDIEAADGVVYVGTTGGIYRSTADGQGWELSGMRNELVPAIAARAGSPIYALVGQGGLFVSRDAGSSWERLARSDAGLSAVAVDLDDPATAYLASYSGTVWKTRDSGMSWQRTSPTGFIYTWALELDPYDDALVILGSNPNGSPALVRSTDGGATFAPVTVTGHPGAQVAAIGGGAEGSHRFYAAFPNSVCRTEDGAATWTCSSIGGYVFRLVEVPAANASSPPTVIASTDRGLFLSHDGGLTWEHAAEPFDSLDYAVAAFDAVSGAVFAGSDTSIHRSADRGSSWTWHGHGLRSAWTTALAVDPADPTKLLAASTGTFDRGLGMFRSSDEGQSWAGLETTNAPSGFHSLLFDRNNSSTVYGVANGGLFKSPDGGQNWSPVLGNETAYLVASDPRSPSEIWVGDARGLARSDDAGATWQRTSLSQDIYSLAFDSHDPATLYAGSYFDVSYGYYAYPEGGSIFVSHDRGATFTRTPNDLGASPVALAADPFAAGVAYAGTAGAGILHTGDGGRTWLPAPAGGLVPRSVTDLVADPYRAGYLYAAADGTIYRSLDGAASWELFADDFDGPAVTHLAIAAGGRRLVAATSGAGIYEIDLASAAPSFPCTADPARLCLLGGRYALEVAALAHGVWGAGTATALTDRAGYFGFAGATGDATFPEVAVKMLPDGALGPGGPAIFHASLTTLPYVLTLTDTVTGQQSFYTSAEGEALCGGSDRPFPGMAAVIQPPGPPPVPGDVALSLLDRRFSVTLHARHAPTGRESNGRAVASGDRWGYFSMPDITGDPSLPEVVVKMIDDRANSGKFWVFHTGLTSFGYTLTVTDTKNGVVRTFESPGAFCGAADTSAFSD